MVDEKLLQSAKDFTAGYKAAEKSSEGKIMNDLRIQVLRAKYIISSIGLNTSIDMQNKISLWLEVFENNSKQNSTHDK